MYTIPCRLLVSLWIMILMIPAVQAVPPYLAIQTADKIYFPDSSCPVAARKMLKDTGFAKVVRYKHGSSVFAAYRNATDYEYKALVKCIDAHDMFVVVAVADSPGKAKRKATQLRQTLLKKTARVSTKPAPETSANATEQATEVAKADAQNTTTAPTNRTLLPASPPPTPPETQRPLDAESQFMVLGEMYYFGKGGVEQDYVEAMRWYQKAADRGNKTAQHTLGVMYYQGKGAPQDFIAAYQWFSIAAARGHQPSAQARDDLVADKLSETQVVEAQKMARQWFSAHHNKK